MSEKTSRNDPSVETLKSPDLATSRPATFAVAGAVVLVVGLVIGLNVAALREWFAMRMGTPRIESIAVMPLENLSHDPAQEYFADGVTDAITNNLGQIGTFRVIARSSVMQYKKAPRPVPDVARELNVASVVEGSVLRSGDRIRITVRLIYAPTNRRLWEQSYERDLRDIEILQADISRAIVSEIKVKLTPQQEGRLTAARQVNAQAYEAYLQAEYGANPAKVGAYLDQAIQLDPNFAAAYAALAGNHYVANYFPGLAPRDVYPKVKEAAQKALSLDPTLVPAHGQLAGVALEYDWDFVEAEKEYKRALEYNPNSADIHHSYAHFLLSMGRTKEASAETQRALEIDPVDAGLIDCVGWHDVTMRNYEDAEKHCLQALSMGTPGRGSFFLAMSYEQRHLFDKAIPEFQKIVVAWGGAVGATAALGHAYATAGKEREAREVLDGLLARSQKAYVSAYEIATIYAGLGDRDRAFEWLQKAYEERSNSLATFRMDPRIWSLQSDARFQDLLRRMNFPL
jgi:TolB-like protein/Tfp pilus assembly protein PilF